jgi:UDP-glucose 4-epimerase
MNIIVTGGAGFIGTNLIKRLLKFGYNVVSIDNYNTGKKTNHLDGATYIEEDIRTVDYNKVVADNFTKQKIDVVYHLAALARIQPSFDKPLEYFEVNATGTIRVADFCSKNNIPLQYAGSSSHHSGKFKNPYTFSKDIGEEVVMLYQDRFKLNATITRFYNVYGPYHLKEGGYCTVIGKWEKAYEEDKPMIIFGDGTKRRDFTHVDDIVDALIAIQTLSKWGKIYELGFGKNYSIKEIFNYYKYSKVEYKEDKPGEAITTLCTDKKAFLDLEWKASIKITDYIKDYIKEYIRKQHII